MRKNLVVIRVGENSPHRKWLDGDPKRSWDLLLCPYQKISFKDALSLMPKDVLISSIIPGLKWSGIRALFAKWPLKRDWHSYRYIVFADEDLQIPPGTWTQFFKTVTEQKAALAAPALTIGSIASHPVTIQQSPGGARPTTFVEVMTPCFRVDVWEKMLPTLDETPSGIGWGLDYVWPKLLNYEGIYVVDETPVTHSNPNHSPQEVSQLGWIEMAAMLKKYDCEDRPERNL